jgi:hypothetical protein
MPLPLPLLGFVALAFRRWHVVRHVWLEAGVHSDRKVGAIEEGCTTGREQY